MIHATINMRRTHSNSQRVSKSDPLRFIPSIRLARRDGLAAAETRLQQADGLHRLHAACCMLVVVRPASAAAISWRHPPSLVA